MLRKSFVVALCALAGCASTSNCKEGSGYGGCGNVKKAGQSGPPSGHSEDYRDYDSDLRELGLVGALRAENFEAARLWMGDTRAERQTLPAWARLSVAMALDDDAEVESILERDSDSLSVVDRVQALRKLGREADALRLVKEAQAGGLSAQQMSALEAQRNEIRRASAQVVDGKWSIRTLGDLQIQSEDGTYGSPLFKVPVLGQSRASVRFTHNNLKGTIAGASVLPINDEYDVSTRYEARINKQHALRLLAGANVRDDSNLPYGNVHWDYQPVHWLEGSVDVGVNELTDFTSFLRAYGALDRATAQVVVWPTSLVTTRLRVGAHRFRTRVDERLGEGYSVDGEVGMRFLSGEPSLHLRLQGGMQANTLSARVPGSLLNSAAIPPGAPLNSLISQQFGQFGFGFRLGLREYSEEVWQLRGFVDGWMGGLWPAGEFAYHFRGGLGTSFLGFDQLSAEAFYANTQGGQQNQAYDGVQVNYRVRF